MPAISQICAFLEEFAPCHLAEEWDNVGLLIGDQAAKAERMMTCLTVTPASAAEAIERGADLIVTHHPFPFRAIKRFTRDTPEGAMLLDLIAAGVGVYSPHTAFDSASAGINQQFALGLRLTDVRPLIEKPAAEVDGAEVEGAIEQAPRLGTGRHGKLESPTTLAEVIARLKAFLQLDHAKFVGDASREVRHVAIACGSAGEFLTTAQDVGADCFITGETSFHTCLAAEASETAMILTGHFASERFAVVELARILGDEFADVEVWASERECDPLRLA